MTVERRFVVGLKDIRAVTLECKKCGARLSLQPNAITISSKISSCHQCGELWFSGSLSHGQFVVSPVTTFFLALPQAIAAQDDERLGVRILFEFDEPRP